MERYRTCETVGRWSTIDLLTLETLTAQGAPANHAAAEALSELLNTLDDQQEWRREARRWPGAVG
ncbi:MAG TPA: hypothetical protein VFW47_08720 [Phenylobacterium sp.]|nr:hypothetical protein [Phenylobacterium sp.]